MGGQASTKRSASGRLCGVCPRTSEGLNAVIDLSHHNQNLDFWSIQVGGEILGIIYKAAQGVRFVDPT